MALSTRQRIGTGLGHSACPDRGLQPREPEKPRTRNKEALPEQGFLGGASAQWLALRVTLSGPATPHEREKSESRQHHRVGLGFRNRRSDAGIVRGAVPVALHFQKEWRIPPDRVLHGGEPRRPLNGFALRQARTRIVWITGVAGTAEAVDEVPRDPSSVVRRGFESYLAHAPTTRRDRH